jgi:methyl-accepting chemotaxis protein
MRDINRPTRKLTKFEAVEGIAFQSNLLALSASVEAASADANSKEFVLVANQVRDLAHRGEQAARALPGDERERIF